MKQNYRLVMLETLKHLEGRPKLLLHACCGPCSSNVIKELCQYFDITIYYTNSNIYPADEYHRRESELERFVKEFNDKENQNVQVVEDTYDPKEYLTHIAPYKDTGEKGYRCYVCYKVRMEKQEIMLECMVLIIGQLCCLFLLIRIANGSMRLVMI